MPAVPADTDVDMPVDLVADLPRELIPWVDLREPHEHEADGWIAGARHGSPADALAALEADPARTVVAVCATGRRSAAWARAMRDAGYGGVVSLAGGLRAWRAAGLPLEGDCDERHARQVALPQVGRVGQRRIAAASVLVVGVGGLGSPASSYLAGAGIGTLGLADGDVVERSNLHRQPIHSEVEIGEAKVASAARAIARRHPDVDVVEHHGFVTPDSVTGLLARGWDVVLDCTDDIGARLALNEAATRLGTPVVHGAVDRFEGRVAVLGAEDGPCYTCIHPTAGRASNRSCAAGGVLGFAPGVVGTLQAGEALKLVLGIASPLRRGVLVVDMLSMRFTTIPVARSPRCPVCAT